MLHQVALTLIPNVGDFLIKQLISYAGSAEDVFKLNKAKLEKIPRVGQVIAQSIVSSDALKKAESILKQAQENNIELLFYTSERYPNRLKVIDDAPCLLYYKGKANLNHEKIIAFVGTRNATEYGKEVTESLVGQLKEHKPIIVSGLAYGIDICAHRAALNAGLPTIGVMANGLDSVYPSRHTSTAREMELQGGLLSENPFGSKPDAPKFPARNRIIAGMSDAIIVVEAAEKGGALITGEIAHSYNKDLFAVPGNINRPYSRGCNALIKSHKAVFLSSIKDLEEAMNWDLKAQENKKKISEIVATLGETEQKIVALLLKNESMIMDELARKTQTEIHQLSGYLLQLELMDLVKVLPGKKYALKF